MKPEFILCAALKFNHNGKDNIISAHRHSDCYDILLNLLDRELTDNECGRNNQGFLTSHNRFVDRAEAFKIAKANNQILFASPNIKDDENILTSEDLY